MLRVRDAANAPHTVARIRIRDAGNVLREVSLIRIRDAANAVRTAFSSASDATVDRAIVEGQITSRNAAPVTTESVTASAGGSAPYIWQWSRTDANPGAWTILSPTSATTAFRATSVAPEETQTATFVATATANGRSVTTPVVTAYASNAGFDNGGIQP